MAKNYSNGNSEKEVHLLERRLIDLSRVAYQRDIITFTDFLNLNEQNILHTLPKDNLYTGYPSAIYYIHCRRIACIQVISFLAGMHQQSVRWRHSSLRLFLYVTGRRIFCRRNSDTRFRQWRSVRGTSGLQRILRIGIFLEQS